MFACKSDVPITTESLNQSISSRPWQQSSGSNYVTLKRWTVIKSITYTFFKWPYPFWKAVTDLDVDKLPEVFISTLFKNFFDSK